MSKQAQTGCKIFIISHCLYEVKLHYSPVVCSLALDCKLSRVPSLTVTETYMVQKRETEKNREKDVRKEKVGEGGEVGRGEGKRKSGGKSQNTYIRNIFGTQVLTRVWSIHLGKVAVLGSSPGLAVRAMIQKQSGLCAAAEMTEIQKDLLLAQDSEFQEASLMGLVWFLCPLPCYTKGPGRI